MVEPGAKIAGKIDPGSQVELIFTITDANAHNGGMYIHANTEMQAGAGMAVVSGGVSHTSPHSFEGGQATFSVTWTAPSTPGAQRFSVAAVAANGDGRNTGDEGLSKDFDLVFGCEPQTFYVDSDGDGYGVDNWTQIFCAGEAPEGFAAVAGDCDNYREEVYPNAVELCNRRDDNCDGEVDEGALEVTLYPDADGDGYYSIEEYLSGDTVLGCVPYEGYAAEQGDCEPFIAEINPGATEVCDDAYDENCDGQVDERLRPTCGVGWCARESRSCSPEDCTPGEPRVEMCNSFDDDCDGEIDNGDLCPPGQICAAGACSIVGDPTVPDDMMTSGATGGTADTGTTGDSTGTGGADSGSTSGGLNPNRTSSSGCSITAGSRRSSWWSLTSLLGVAWLLRRRRSPKGGAGLARATGCSSTVV